MQGPLSACQTYDLRRSCIIHAFVKVRHAVSSGISVHNQAVSQNAAAGVRDAFLFNACLLNFCPAHSAERCCLPSVKQAFQEGYHHDAQDLSTAIGALPAHEGFSRVPVSKEKGAQEWQRPIE